MNAASADGDSYGVKMDNGEFEMVNGLTTSPLAEKNRQSSLATHLSQVSTRLNLQVSLLPKAFTFVQ
jgi:hypothetical protein